MSPRKSVRALMLALVWIASLAAAAVAYAKVIAVSGNDSAAIQAAIDTAGPGDTIRLAAKAYLLSSPVTLKSRLRLLGAGRDKTALRFAGDSPGVLFDLSGCEGVELAGFTLDAAGNPKAHQGIYATRASRLNIHHLAIRNFVAGSPWGPHGILFSGENPTRAHGVTDSVIADCLFENIAPDSPWSAAIRLAWGSSRNRVLRNVIHNTGRGGILANDGSSDLVIRGNVISGSGGEGLGIEVWVGCDRAVIEDNHIDHWLSIGACDFCAVRRNVISDHSGVVKFIGIEGIGNWCVITDNVVDDGQQIGLSVSAPMPKNYFYWANNTVRACVQWGAQLQGEEGGIAYHYFYRCRFLGTTVGRGNPAYPGDEGHGFRTNGNVRHLTMEECEFSENAGYGLQLGGAGVDCLSFIACRIANNKAAAVVGPPDYHGPANPEAYTALEWTDCIAEGNADNHLPPEKPFATARPH
ncbi:MAG: right-handed parallel beta-helix repeat-containing protein, partial [Armatimonadetes bacterium]|nr:right-handed parallel beta-helix repeat-containing protein [Armatimonadota bacterium]